MLETKNPGAGRLQGFKIGIGCDAGSKIEVTSPPPVCQVINLRTHRISRQFGMSLSTARTVAEIAFGDIPDAPDPWMSLAEAAASAFQSWEGADV